jgi:hypothetical protein
MIRLNQILLLPLFALAACRPPAAEIQKPPAEATKPDSEWDRHEYFDDLGQSSYDSLYQVITRSDSVVAFNWNDKAEDAANTQRYIVNAYGTFNNDIGKRFLLNKKQREKLAKLLTDTANLSSASSMCFVPHIAFVYYKKGRINGQTSLCFVCAQARSIPKIGSDLSDTGTVKLKEFCKSIGLRIVERLRHS